PNTRNSVPNTRNPVSNIQNPKLLGFFIKLDSDRSNRSFVVPDLSKLCLTFRILHYSQTPIISTPRC
ncbi:3474_t:CDS:1, partial [Ambispora gerdemannii]